MDRRLNAKLRNIYYNPKNVGSFGGVERLYRASKVYSKNEIRDWLQKQDVYTLHKPARKHFKRSRILVSSIDDVWQMDLVDMQQFKCDNDNYKYLLTCIDVFSKYAWAIPVKNKTSAEILDAIKEILSYGRKPKKIQTDAGKEFTNSLVQRFLINNSIGFYTTYSELKASVVERFNRTLKTRMWRYFTFKGKHRYIDALPSLIKSYNNSYHRTIKTAPVLVSRCNESRIRESIYSDLQLHSGKLKPGDQVRISKTRNIFAKGYLPNWTEEVFTIVKSINRDPKSYVIKDAKDRELKGAFYEEELQKVHKREDDLWRIEKIIKECGKGKQKFFLVKWMGYSDEHNSWVKEKDIVNF